MIEPFNQDKPQLTLQADAKCGNDRIDRFLANAFRDQKKSLSRSRIKALILDHQLSESGNTLSDPSAPVKSGATYVLTLPLPVDALPKGENLPLDILFEDDHIIVINKPAGLVVHPAPGSPTGTLVNALIGHCGESLTGIGGVLRPGIVHRLDKDTSGVMIAAKTAISHANLTSMFAAHDLDRRYQALVWGTEINRNGTVDAPIGRSNFERKKQAVKSNGRKAITHWHRLRSFPPFATLLECQLETGRTHQIRVHMAHIGRSIIGDPLYGRAPRAGQMPDGTTRTCLAQLRNFRRQALHAAHLGLAHPVTGEAMRFTSELPRDIQTLIKIMDNAIAIRASGKI
jgi:23S rRNA pseudouridine1911/1915/1917 synthase